MRKKVVAFVVAAAMMVSVFPSPAAAKTKAAESSDLLPKPAYCWDFDNVTDNKAANKGAAGEGIAVLEGTAGTAADSIRVGETDYKDGENKVLVLEGGAKGSSYVSLPSELYQGVNAETGFSYSFWLRPDSTVASYARVISSANASSGNEFAFAPYASDKVWNILFDDNDVVRAPMTEPEKGEWSFIAFTVSKEEITFYINGEEKGAFADSALLTARLNIMETMVNNALGKTCSNWTDRDAKVRLDDLCLYKTALTSKEVAGLAREQGFDVKETTEKGGANELTDGTAVTDTGLSVSGYDITAKIVEDKETGRFFITASRKGDILLDASQLGVKASEDFTQEMSYVEGSEKTVEGTDQYKLTTGAKSGEITDAYHELSFRLQKKNDASKVMMVYVRIYEDGVAYRYELGGEAGTKETVRGEASEFVLPADSVIWAGYDNGGNYEYAYQRLRMSAVKSSSAKYSVPLLANSGNNWMLFIEAAVFSQEDTYCASHLATAAGSRNLKFAFGKGSGNSITMTYDEEGTIHTPWRVAMMSDNLNDIVNATMVSSLNPDPDPELYQDTSWIKTGTVAWSWWSEAGDDPIEYDQQKDYIDFAAENGWEYVCLDFGWCLWKDYKTKVKELVDYGKEKGVGIILWYGVNNDNHAGFKDADGKPAYPKYSLRKTEQLEEQFAWCEEVGVRGVKVDYYENDDKGTMTQMYECATIAAKHKINVLFHGCTAPRGEIRTFPNVLGYEAVQGSEWYKWNIGPSVSNCLLYVFNRNVVGGMDFTPVGTQVAQISVTAGFQLAQVIAYQTGLQNIASSVYKLEGYGGLAMINDVPTQWDETVLLDGDPGRRVTIARRNGEDWYIAAMTAEAGEETVSLDFLSEGSYKAYIYKDNAGGTDVVLEEREVTKSSELTLSLAANGGAAIKITKEPMKTATKYDDYSYYEAEDSGNDRSGNVMVSANQFASGMKQVTGIGGTVNNKLTFHAVSAPEDGVYEMRLYYACGVDRRVVYSINGEDEIRSGKLNAGVNTLAMERFYVRLKKGENTISFGNTTAKAPNIDRIAISKNTVDQPVTETDPTDDGDKPVDGTQYDYTMYGPGSAVLSGGARIENNAIGWLGGSSANKAVFKVTVEKAGTYKLQLNYCTGAARNVDISVNGGEKIHCACPSTGSYLPDSAESVYTDIVLKAGENTVELGNASADCPNIVSLGISKTAIKEDNTDATPKPSETDDPDKDAAPKAEKINVKAKGYELSKITLKKGKKVKLVTAVLPAGADQKLVFTSDKQSVATVNEQGVVKAKKAGKVKITAATADGSLKKTISIWVVKKNKKNTKLVLKKNKTSLRKGQTAQISVKKLTKKTTDKITYKVSAGKKYIRVDAYGTVSVKKFKKKASAVVTVRCGRKSRKFKVALKA